MAETNYDIESVNGEWSALDCSNGAYDNAFPKEGGKGDMNWNKLHLQYDDIPPREKLEMTCILAGNDPNAELRRQLRDA
ncbi:TenA family transcriptional regulator, partial [Pseudomonas aeruginosa]